MKKLILKLLLRVTEKLAESKAINYDLELKESLDGTLSILLRKINEGTLGIESESFLKRKITYYSDRQREQILQMLISEAFQTQKIIDTLEAKLELHYGK